MGGGMRIDDGCIAEEELRIHLLGHNFCTIGKNCIFADRIKIMCSDAHSLFDEQRNILNANSPVYIGNHVWIGYAVTILKGSTVPDGCHVTAGSIVNKEFKETNAILDGRPARCIQSNIEWSIKNPEDFK